jgi:hypothetical protein
MAGFQRQRKALAGTGVVTEHPLPFNASIAPENPPFGRRGKAGKTRVGCRRENRQFEPVKVNWFSR